MNLSIYFVVGGDRDLVLGQKIKFSDFGTGCFVESYDQAHNLVSSFAKNSGGENKSSIIEVLVSVNTLLDLATAGNNGDLCTNASGRVMCIDSYKF